MKDSNKNVFRMRQSLAGLMRNSASNDFYKEGLRQAFENIKRGLFTIREHPEVAKEQVEEMIDFFCLDEDKW